MVTLFQTLHTLSYVVVDRMKTVKEEKGASAIEYAILVACIAAVVIAAVALLGGKIKSLFDGISLGSSTPATTVPATTTR
ncbi:MAG: Flp/Fap pilin component [Modestobacter sp.]|nr:Flp/Fap pilin component [Modestobacter sp.]